MPHRSTTSPEEAAALQEAGARLVRHAHDMVLALPARGAQPRIPDGITLRTGIAPVPAMVRVRLLAYPPGHPDAGFSGRSAADHEQDLTELLSGRLVGSVLEDASAVTTDAAGAVAGAVVVTRIGPEPWGWAGGPWVADVMVVPAWQGRGLGRALLLHAITRCSAAGEARIGLTVTDGNPAERLYAALGFQRRRTLYVLEE
ncbi:MAG TPA: GNAT family N-acetyltransferase [Terriglobales bacterium]|nr:GNAT family N-acetyltransferase [Terriglobales bacterium]